MCTKFIYTRAVAVQNRRPEEQRDSPSQWRSDEIMESSSICLGKVRDAPVDEVVA
jgi:hypothetical protein